MSWFTGAVLYVLIWWTMLFAVLPWGTHPSAEPDSITGWRGVPARPRMALKLLATTVVAAVVWGLIALLIGSSWLSFRTGFLALPPAH
jgi:predicted secreted protein